MTSLRTMMLCGLLAMGCASARPPTAHAPRGGPCADNVTLACLAGRVCAWDDARGCERCRCADPAYVPLGR